MQIETRRLILREMTMADFPALHTIFSDSETMRFYPGTFDEERTRAWIRRNRQRYATDGFGLMSVVLRETGEVIGDCGVTLQPIHGVMLPEVSYHIRKDLWHRGYAGEAAQRCMEFLFETTDYPAVYSCMKYTNAASCGVALKNGMHAIEEFDEPVNVRTRVYGVTREEWMREQVGVFRGCPEDIDHWMALVNAVRDEFPGLETQAAMDAHRQTVLRFMQRGEALCARQNGKLLGLLLYSKRKHMICFLAVDPQHRRRGAASRLLARALEMLDCAEEISLSTFRADDPRGEAPRKLYSSFGFCEGECLIEQGYPCQKFFLRR